MKIQIEDSVISCKRGVYGIFIIKNGGKSCSYVGKSEQLVIRAEKHKMESMLALLLLHIRIPKPKFLFRY